MSRAEQAEQLVRQSDPAGALEALKPIVRAHPADAEVRIFLFQLLCIMGDWDRAATQLEVVEQLAPAAMPMVQTCRAAILCERLRAEVFAGRKSPMLCGEPEPWLARLIEALLREGRGEADAARHLRAQALEQAPASSGRIDGVPFAWIADGDTRLGPVLEGVVNGKYYWIPFSRLARVAVEAPVDLRDAVWAPAELEFANGGALPAMIPTRYPEHPAANEGLLLMARETRWREVGADAWQGVGQRMLITDVGEHALLDVREILVDDTPAPAEAAGDG